METLGKKFRSISKFIDAERAGDEIKDLANSIQKRINGVRTNTDPKKNEVPREKSDLANRMFDRIGELIPKEGKDIPVEVKRGVLGRIASVLDEYENDILGGRARTTHSDTNPNRTQGGERSRYESKDEDTSRFKIQMSIINGVTTYYKVPRGCSMNIINGRVEFIYNGRKVNPQEVSEDVARNVYGFQGSVNSSGDSYHFNGGGSFHFSGSGVNNNTGRKETVSNGSRINSGIHNINVADISSLDRISGGVVNLSGNGTISMSRISGGVVNIGSGVTVNLSRISGGVVNIGSGAIVNVSDRLSGGIISVGGRINYTKNTGAIIN